MTYAGPAEWSFRQLILHYAHLCKAAGGVDAFLLSSEHPRLTTLRSGAGTYPFVDALADLAAEVRGALGNDVRLSYGADWSEYFGHHPDDGSGDGPTGRPGGASPTSAPILPAARTRSPA